MAAIRRAVGRGGRLDATNSQGLTPLMLAANHGHPRALVALAELGADVDRTSAVHYPGRWTGFTALMAASCDSTGRLEPVETLIELGADPGAEDQEGRRAVDYARISGYVEIADYLSTVER